MTVKEKGMSTTLIGTIGELEFHIAAVRRGLICNRPYTDYNGYDFIVDTRKSLTRVQVKVSDGQAKAKDIFTFNFSTGHKHNYDILALRPGKEADWYLIPREDLDHIKHSITLTREGKYESYRNNWNIFGVDDIELCK